MECKLQGSVVVNESANITVSNNFTQLSIGSIFLIVYIFTVVIIFASIFEKFERKKTKKFKNITNYRNSIKDKKNKEVTGNE
jgi:hypothetical protein